MNWWGNSENFCTLSREAKIFLLFRAVLYILWHKFCWYVLSEQSVILISFQWILFYLIDRWNKILSHLSKSWNNREVFLKFTINLLTSNKVSHFVKWCGNIVWVDDKTKRVFEIHQIYQLGLSKKDYCSKLSFSQYEK